MSRVEEDPTLDAADADAYVFAKPDGRPTHPQLLSDAFKKMVKRSGLPRIRLHDLRVRHEAPCIRAG